MLEELTVANLGVVEAAAVSFAPGLNVITGETGAGKTLVVEALSLLLGARAAPALVGPAGAEARVDGRFRSTPAVEAYLEEAGLEADDEVVVSRRLPRNGASRAWVNGRPVAAGTLAEAGLAVAGVEARLVGGECPYWGCVPSKMMIRAGDLIAEGNRVNGMSGSARVDPVAGRFCRFTRRTLLVPSGLLPIAGQIAGQKVGQRVGMNRFQRRFEHGDEGLMHARGGSLGERM